MLFIVPVLSTRSYTYEWHVAFEIVRNYGYRRLGIAVFWRHAKQLANLAIHLLAHRVVNRVGPNVLEKSIQSRVHRLLRERFGLDLHGGGHLLRRLSLHHSLKTCQLGAL